MPIINLIVDYMIDDLDRGSSGIYDANWVRGGDDEHKQFSVFFRTLYHSDAAWAASNDLMYGRPDEPGLYFWIRDLISPFRFYYCGKSELLWNDKRCVSGRTPTTRMRAIVATPEKCEEQVRARCGSGEQKYFHYAP